MEKLGAPILDSKVKQSSNSRKYQKEGNLTIYSELINYLLESYATDYVITEMDFKILQFTQLSGMTPTEYAEAL